MTPDEQDTTVNNQPLPPGRRRFLEGACLALGAAVAALLAIPVVGFLLAPLLEKTPSAWRSVGPVSKFTVGQTVEVSFDDASPLPWAGLTARTAAWLRRESEHDFVAFSINCTHLGCPVQWQATATLFLCPCHGGVYYKDGTVAAGPPPRPLPRYAVRVRNGQVQILTGPIPITRSI